MSLQLEPEQSDITIEDPIYGQPTTLSSKTGDSCLIDIIRSEAFERLKLVFQHGISAASLFNGELCPQRVNRWQHSVGAMLLVRKLGASKEEQLAAVSTPTIWLSCTS